MLHSAARALHLRAVRHVALARQASNKAAAVRPLASYPFRLAIPTRWMDYDLYGHVNNVQYYSYFDTAVNSMLIARAAFSPATDAVVGYCVASQCDFRSPLTFPDTVHAGLGVARLGTSSVSYEVALFREAAGAKPAAASDLVLSASGSFTHVMVDRATNKPVPIPAQLRRVLDGMILHASQ